MYKLWSLNTVVGIATGYGLDDRGVGVRVPVESRIFSFPLYPNRFWGPPICNGALSPRVNWPGREADHSSPLSAEFKKTGSIHTLAIRLHGVVLN
jgi:hypothetical protein